MKWRLSILSVCVIGMLGCADFLEESSQDEVRPSTVNDMEQLLRGEVYMSDGEWESFFDVTKYFTDEIQCNGLVDEKQSTVKTLLERYRWEFTWDRNMYAEEGGGENAYVWSVPYRCIKGCNVILEYLDRVTGDDVLREYLRGESYAMRGFYYFYLVNFFGEPYNVGNPESDLGVPLKLRMGVTDELFRRNTVQEVYERIEADLLEGVRLMKANPVDNIPYFRMTLLGGWAMLSRMYLYQEDWDKAAAYADSVLIQKPDLLDLSALVDGELAIGEQNDFGNVYSESTPQEIIWACRTKNTASSSTVPAYSISEDFLGTYDSDLTNTENYGDLRKYFYFCYYEAKENGRVVESEPYYVRKDFSYDVLLGIRTAELYLNRAEANIHRFMETGEDAYRVAALDDLNHLREVRYDTRNVAYEPVDIADAETLLTFCREERARELCGEGCHRWFDLRRYGKPELQHVYFMRPGQSEETHILEEGSSHYLLPIPDAVMEANSQLEQNI